jgi:hypothetical protein
MNKLTLVFLAVALYLIYGVNTKINNMAKNLNIE